MRPFPPLTVSTSPFGAMISPSGVLSALPLVIIVPVPALLERQVARRLGATDKAAAGSWSAAPARAEDASAILRVIPTGLSPFHGWTVPRHGGERPEAA